MRRGAGVFNFQQMEKRLLFSLILLFWFILHKNPYKGFQRIVAPVKSVAGKEATAQPTAGGPAWFPGEDERGWDVPDTWSKPGTLICSEYLLNTSKTILGRNTIKRNFSLSLKKAKSWWLSPLYSSQCFLERFVSAKGRQKTWHSTGSWGSGPAPAACRHPACTVTPKTQGRCLQQGVAYPWLYTGSWVFTGSHKPPLAIIHVLRIMFPIFQLGSPELIYFACFDFSGWQRHCIFLSIGVFKLEIFFPGCFRRIVTQLNRSKRAWHAGAASLLQMSSHCNFCLSSEKIQALLLEQLNSPILPELTLPVTLRQKNLPALPRDICAHKHLD